MYLVGYIVVTIDLLIYSQSSSGDVAVMSGRKRLRVSPTRGLMYVSTHFAELMIGGDDWTVRVRRGDNRLLATASEFRMSNSRFEIGFDAMLQQLYVHPLQKKKHALIGKQVMDD